MCPTGGPRPAEPTGGQDRKRSRVVYVTHHLPWPTDSGGRVREAQLIARLADRFDIELVAVTKDLDKDRRGLGQASALGVRARLFAATPVGGVAGPHARRHGSASARRYLHHRSVAREPGADVVHVEGHYLMPLLPRAARRRVVLVEHNIESTLFLQAAHSAGPARPNLVATLAGAALTRLDERRAWQAARIVVGITAEDVATIADIVGPARVRLVPNGADHVGEDSAGEPGPDHPGTASGAGRLVFVGNFAYLPNAEAARELIDSILPAVRARVGPVPLALVGSGPPRWLRDAADRCGSVTVTGPVGDVIPWLRAAAVVVAPLRRGGGVKVKVLEALALGKAVVTTGVGAQGLRRLPPGSLVVAEDPRDFAAAVARLLTHESERRRQEARARLAARQLPTWDAAAEQLAACWNEA